MLQTRMVVVGRILRSPNFWSFTQYLLVGPDGEAWELDQLGEALAEVGAVVAVDQLGQGTPPVLLEGQGRLNNIRRLPPWGVPPGPSWGDTLSVPVVQLAVAQLLK